MLERARDLRNRPTPFEKTLWSKLSRSQLGGYKFRRQAVIGQYICDFFCPSKGLIVEVDGDTHDRAMDERRDAVLRNQGFSVLRFTNRDAGSNVEGVLEEILMKLDALPDRWGQPHPNPSPEGEGLS
ncbi:MAG: endonuclease domain-containing protein [Parasphingopyxis sp.]